MDYKNIKLTVQEKYGQIADKSSGCCDSSPDYSVMADDYKHLAGYVADADLKLGCGVPVEYAEMKAGSNVLDLGSGAGNDCFVARAIVGESGKVTGIDFTASMVEKANVNKQKMGYENVHFIQGDIEDMPLDNNEFDVVISNCVLNLVPNKPKAFSEIFRVLKDDAHFCVSDIVLSGEMPEEFKQEASLYAGCVSSAIQQDEYLQLIHNAGFSDIEIRKRKIIELPDDILEKYLTNKSIEDFKALRIGIFSITVFAKK